ncbi:MAG: UpxY family transcription antiterminator [Phycisphaerae bacterium]|nr:UpxY family transcription antiterminator [Phycisphaerae bacterium]
MLKSSENPPMLYPEFGLVLVEESKWWVAHVKSRNEKAFAWNLHQWEIPYFLPLIEKVTQKKGRKFRSQLPLFTGYMFFHANEDQRSQALCSNRIANLIEVIDQQRFIEELKAVHLAISSGFSVETHSGLAVGKRCRVVAGPLIGQEGVVVRQKGITRIFLQIDILGQSAAVEIDADMLEPAEE